MSAGLDPIASLHVFPPRGRTRLGLCFASTWLAAVWFPSLVCSQRAADSSHTRKESYGATARAAVVNEAANEALRESRTGSQSVVTRRDMLERQPLSAPDALTFEPGVYVQQTAHGQASPYVRGMTGQQVLHLFDGIRLNNGTYRQGPNQYFFTVDWQTLERVEVERGSASTRYGPDALGGVILAEPVEPWLNPPREVERVRPRLFSRARSADGELGGRAQIEVSVSPKTALLVGGGARRVGRLTSGGQVRRDGYPSPQVPRFERDGNTQLGTGFNEATFDGRLLHQLHDNLLLTAAVYGYRQFDAPRTDQCPPIEAPLSECLTIEEQFRTLSYLKLKGEASSQAMESYRMTLSFQQVHELMKRLRPRSYVEQEWEDDVDTVGLAFSAQSAALVLPGAGALRWLYGADLYLDRVASDSERRLTSLGLTIRPSRGRYINGSTYAIGGAFSELQWEASEEVTLTAGARGAFAHAESAADPASNTEAVSRPFASMVGRAGIAYQVTPAVALLSNIDQGFRAPNLDDLTSRTQTGPGFQLENTALRPEKSTTIESGMRLSLPWMSLDAWAFSTFLEEAIVRSVRRAEDCPPETPSCNASWAQLQLANAEDTAVIYGADGRVTFFFPRRVSLRATTSYAWGEASNTSTGDGFAFGASSKASRVPLSRIPPLNGALELRWHPRGSGATFSAAMRWALAQTRLAPSDLNDVRIPPGGTPGYAALDVRSGCRFSRHLSGWIVLENLLNTAYRVHGSSINGAGRSATLALSAGW